MRDTAASGAEADIQREKDLTACAVLEEVFQLLERYAPSWYTEAHHDRILAALDNSRPADERNG